MGKNTEKTVFCGEGERRKENWDWYVKNNFFLKKAVF